jgi:hypothetical protein
MLTGGYIKDIPKPHRRMFPGKTKRKLRISVARYSCGVHYYVTIREEDNPIWDKSLHGPGWGKERADKPIGWHVAWDDKKGKGREFEQRCNTSRAASKYIADMVAKHFPADLYEIEGDSFTNKITHQYKREGD